jgi:hypothetical protein
VVSYQTQGWSWYIKSTEADTEHHPRKVTRGRKASFSRLWNRSTNPFDWGWYASWVNAGC